MRTQNIQQNRTFGAEFKLIDPKNLIDKGRIAKLAQKAEKIGTPEDIIQAKVYPVNINGEPIFLIEKAFYGNVQTSINRNLDTFNIGHAYNRLTDGPNKRQKTPFAVISRLLDKLAKNNPAKN